MIEVGADSNCLNEVLEEYNTTYDDNFLYLAKPFDGIIEMLKSLREMGIVVAILSNKPHTTTVKISNN